MKHKARKVLADKTRRVVDRETRQTSALAPSRAAHLARPSKLVPVPNALLAKLDRPSHGGGARGAQFLGDDAIVLGFQNSSSLVQLATQEEITVWAGGAGASFDRGSGRVLLAEKGALTLVDANSGKPLARWQAGITHAASVCFSPDGALASVCSTDGVLELWDTKGGKGIPQGLAEDFTPRHELPMGKPLASLGGHSGWVACATFSPDGSLLVSGDSHGKLCIWNVARRSLATAITFKGEVVKGTDFTLDGQGVVVGLESGLVQIVELRGQVARQWATKDAVLDLRVLPGGTVATIGWKALSLWDLSSGRKLARLARKPGEQTPKIADVRGNLLLTRGPVALIQVV